jgi:hypothetical protein
LYSKELEGSVRGVTVGESPKEPRGKKKGFERR